jgi:hypothetical protein
MKKASGQKIRSMQNVWETLLHGGFQIDVPVE